MSYSTVITLLIAYCCCGTISAAVIRSRPAKDRTIMKCNLKYVKPKTPLSSEEVAEQVYEHEMSLANALHHDVEILKQTVHHHGTWFKSVDASWDMPENFDLPIFMHVKTDGEIHDDLQKFLHMTAALLGLAKESSTVNEKDAQNHLKDLLKYTKKFRCSLQILIHAKATDMMPDYSNWSTALSDLYEKRFMSAVKNTFTLPLAREIFSGALQYMQDYRDALEDAN